MKNISKQEAMSKAAAYCSVAEHCISEVTRKLSDWGAEAEAIPSIIQHLVEEKYIDEERYCRCFANEKLLSKWGRTKIAYALAAKNIPQDTISECLSEQIDPQEYERMLSALLESKRKTIKARNAYELDQKLMRFVASRGFEPGIIYKCIRPDGHETQHP